MSNAAINHADLERNAAEARVPYRHPQPKECFPELVIPNAIPEDERLWVPQQENVWFRPLCLSASRGYWMNLLRVRKSGVLSRHRHPQPVHGFVLKGSWHYLEHDWTATEGSYVYETPGETHTLVVEPDVPEMITLFQVNGAMIYVDPDGRMLGYEDVFTKIDLCRKHYTAVGLERVRGPVFRRFSSRGHNLNCTPFTSFDKIQLTQALTALVGSAESSALLCGPEWREAGDGEGSGVILLDPCGHLFAHQAAQVEVFA